MTIINSQGACCHILVLKKDFHSSISLRNIDRW